MAIRERNHVPQVTEHMAINVPQVTRGMQRQMGIKILLSILVYDSDFEAPQNGSPDPDSYAVALKHISGFITR
jgi:hypothetical protein